MSWEPSDDERRKLMKDDSAFVTDSELAGLMMERTMGARVSGTVESPIAQARRMLQENAPMAAASLIKLAKHSENDSVRLRAATEILNRAEEIGNGAQGKEPWAELLEDTIVEAEKHANG